MSRNSGLEDCIREFFNDFHDDFFDNFFNDSIDKSFKGGIFPGGWWWIRRRRWGGGTGTVTVATRRWRGFVYHVWFGCDNEDGRYGTQTIGNDEVWFLEYLPGDTGPCFLKTGKVNKTPGFDFVVTGWRPGMRWKARSSFCQKIVVSRRNSVCGFIVITSGYGTKFGSKPRWYLSI